MAAHSSTLAWRIPWMEEPGRLQTMVSLRVRHDWVTFTFHFHVLEKEMATHSSVLAWRIPGTGEPGGLPSMGSHRVGHDWSDLAAADLETGVLVGGLFGNWPRPPPNQPMKKGHWFWANQLEARVPLGRSVKIKAPFSGSQFPWDGPVRQRVEDGFLCSLLAGALVHICKEHTYLERRWWTKAWVLPSESRQPEANVLC